RAQRNVRDHPHSHRLVEEGGEGFRRGPRRRRAGVVEDHVPVLVEARLPALPDQQVPWRNLANVLEHRAWSRDYAEGEVIAEPFHTDAPLDARVPEERLDLRGENQSLAIDMVVERLLPRAVPAQNQAAPGLVPEREGEHAAQSL